MSRTSLRRSIPSRDTKVEELKKKDAGTLSKYIERPIRKKTFGEPVVALSSSRSFQTPEGIAVGFFQTALSKLPHTSSITKDVKVSWGNEIQSYPDLLRLNGGLLARAMIYLHIAKDVLTPDPDFYGVANDAGLLDGLSLPEDGTRRSEKKKEELNMKAADSLLRYVLLVLDRRSQSASETREIISVTTQYGESKTRGPRASPPRSGK